MSGKVLGSESGECMDEIHTKVRVKVHGYSEALKYVNVRVRVRVRSE